MKLAQQDYVLLDKLITLYEEYKRWYYEEKRIYVSYIYNCLSNLNIKLTCNIITTVFINSNMNDIYMDHLNNLQFAVEIGVMNVNLIGLWNRSIDQMGFSGRMQKLPH